MDERPARRETEPERAEVGEHDLVLGRLAEDAHVRGSAVADQVPRAGRVAAVLGALGLTVLRLLDLAADGGDHDVAAKAHAGVAQGADGLEVARERALHVRDPEAVDAALALESLRLEAGDAASQGSRPE